MPKLEWKNVYKYKEQQRDARLVKSQKCSCNLLEPPKPHVAIPRRQVGRQTARSEFWRSSTISLHFVKQNTLQQMNFKKLQFVGGLDHLGVLHLASFGFGARVILWDPLALFKQTWLHMLTANMRIPANAPYFYSSSCAPEGAGSLEMPYIASFWTKFT